MFDLSGVEVAVFKAKAVASVFHRAITRQTIVVAALEKEAGAPIAARRVTGDRVVVRAVIKEYTGARITK